MYIAKKIVKSLNFILGNLIIVGCVSVQIPNALTKITTWQQHQQIIKHLTTWHIVGKIGFANKHQGGNATLDWHQAKTNFAITLHGPFKIETVHITGKPGTVLLATSAGTNLTATTPEAIIQQQLGWTVPITGLIYWARGIPIDNAPIDFIQVPEDNRLTKLKQQGWEIEYNEYQNFNQYVLPTKITLHYDTIKIKLIFKNWL